MGEGLKIGEHIYSHTLFGDGCRFSPLGDLNEFFSPIPEKVQKLWMLDLSDEGYKTAYEKALIVSEQLGFSKALYISCTISNSENSYKVSRKILFDDDKLNFVHEAILQDNGSPGANFSGLMMSKAQKFLSEYDKTRDIKFDNNYSEINLQALSDQNPSSFACGGYVWANQGFDFASEKELPVMRAAFKGFLAERGVTMDDKDLKKFTKPCHFAAFGCGISVTGSNGLPMHLGKAFMLRQKWFGRWSAANPKAEEKRYAEAYNRPGVEPTARRRIAVETLSKSYRGLLKKFYAEYAPAKSLGRLDFVLGKAVRRWSELKNFNHR